MRRRVYDALNVLMAMNIISKEKKEIKWIGLPVTSYQESTTLTQEREDLMARLNEKQAFLHELIVQVCTVVIKEHLQSISLYKFNIFYAYIIYFIII